MFEDTMPEISPNLKRGINLYLRGWENPKQDKLKKSMLRHIIIKLLKTKDIEKSLNDSWSLTRNHKSRKKWHIFQVLKEKNCQPRIPNPAKISFRHEEVVKAF